MVEKAVNAKTKAGLQPSPETKKIDSRCPKKYRLSIKKDKDNAYWEQYNEATNRDKEKAKSHNPFSSTNQSQTQAFSFKKCQRKGREGHPAVEVNATKIAKKNNDKTKNLSHIKCYICKQKGHYTNKYPKKPKN